MIRFWDTSALVKVFKRGEPAHARAVNLVYGAGKGTLQATSMIAAVELIAALIRETGDRRLAAQATDLLKRFDQAEFGHLPRDLAVRLAFQGRTRGADTAIAAQALVLSAAGARLEFVSADKDQCLLVGSEAKARRLDVRLIVLPV